MNKIENEDGGGIGGYKDSDRGPHAKAIKERGAKAGCERTCDAIHASDKASEGYGVD
jgi:hypothetical protein